MLRARRPHELEQARPVDGEHGTLRCGRGRDGECRRGAVPDSATLLRRLHLVEGQVAGLVRMVEAGRPHRDVIIQVSAATHALHRIGFLLVAEEMRNGDLTDESAAAARRIAALEKLFMSLA